MIRVLFPAFLLACSDSSKNQFDCPSNASGQFCECDEGYYGNPSQGENGWSGECVFGLDMALSTGDPSYLVDESSIIQRALAELDKASASRQDVLHSIFQDDAIDYTPTEWSNHIRNMDLESNFIFLVGSEAGHSLAVAGEGDAARRMGFGANVVSMLYGGELSAFETHFDRSLRWLMSGNPDAPIVEARVALTGIGWWTDEYRAYLSEIRPDWETVVCDDASAYESCVESADLWVLGSEGTDEDAERLGMVVSAAHSSGMPVLYSHTQTWSEKPFGVAAITPLGMAFGDYGGNYWSADRAQWGHVDSVLGSGGLIGDLQRLLEHLRDGDYHFDFSYCTEFVGQISCEDVPGIQSEFFAGARALKTAFNRFDSQGVKLFDQSGYVVWKLLALLGDWYRRDIVYPMSKADTDIMPFFRGYFADHAVLALREFNPAQQDLGTFSDMDVSMISPADVTRDVLLSKHGGFTAAGVYALPGQPVFIRRLSDEGPEVSVRINTQRTGSTREFNDDQYTRPKFLSSSYVPIPREGDLFVTWPYGGSIQIYSKAFEEDVVVSLGFDNVGQHPVLWPETSLDDYQSLLNSGDYSMTELYNPYVQIHSQTSMMQEAIEAYDGDLGAFFWDLETYMILDTYNLAGFTGEGLSLKASVASICDNLNWDCVDEGMHGRPALQHINVDYYSHCGGGCSGNPYDQAWPLGPLGWGETHEIGHNLQRNRLRVYGPRSSEVSNQIFPLRKHALWYEDTGESLTPNRIDFEGTFEKIQYAFPEVDALNIIYEDLWASEGIYDNNAQRMAFYMQLVYLGDQRVDFESGWDVYTLIYLQERLFSFAVDADWPAWADRLGFSNYSSPPTDISGNDFLLISASFLLERDLRHLFAAWGIENGLDASEQVESYGFQPAELLFYAAENGNDLTSVFTVPIDGVSVWPN